MAEKTVITKRLRFPYNQGGGGQSNEGDHTKREAVVDSNARLTLPGSLMSAVRGREDRERERARDSESERESGRVRERQID